jgi:hypothetical protein
MSATLLHGPVKWGMTRDHEGFREYKIVRRILTTSAADGPFTVLNCPGLPAIGGIYYLGNDLDPWVWCYPDAVVELDPEYKAGEPGHSWLLTQTFGNKQGKRCQDQTVQDPLLEPMKVSGSFVTYNEPALTDKDGNLLQLPSFELMKIEFDKTRATVRIEQNVAQLGLYDFSAMVNTVNKYPLWGMPERCIKLSRPTWERKVWGTCTYYYTRVFDFDIQPPETSNDGVVTAGFDRFEGMVGEKVFAGSWSLGGDGKWVYSAELDSSGGMLDNIPTNYIRHVDNAGNPTTYAMMRSPGDAITPEGAAVPWDGDPDADYRMLVQKYQESDFLQLGIPTVL